MVKAAAAATTPTKKAVAKSPAKGKKSPTTKGKAGKGTKETKKRRKKREPKLDENGEPIKRSNGGLSKPMRLSDELAAFLGVREDSRCQVRPKTFF